MELGVVGVHKTDVQNLEAYCSTPVLQHEPGVSNIQAADTYTCQSLFLSTIHHLYGRNS